MVSAKTACLSKLFLTRRKGRHLATESGGKFQRQVTESADSDHTDTVCRFGMH